MNYEWMYVFLDNFNLIVKFYKVYLNSIKFNLRNKNKKLKLKETMNLYQWWNKNKLFQTNNLQMILILIKLCVWETYEYFFNYIT